MTESRLDHRIGCGKTATLILGDTRLRVIIVDVSYNGMGIEVQTEKWEPLNFALEVKDEVVIQEKMTSFSARICWTSDEEDQTKAGLETKDIPQEIWQRWVDQLRSVQPAQDNTFTID